MAELTVDERKALAEKKRLERMAAKSEGTSEAVGGVSVGVVRPANSILRKAASLGTPSTLVIGNAGSGKSTLVRDILLRGARNPLWLPLNNAAVLVDERCGTWDTAVPSDWSEFVSGILKPAINGDLTGYDALVIDGGNILTAYAVSHEAPSGQAERSDWLKASNKLRDALVKLRDKFGELYVIIDVVADKDGGRKIDLNPYAKNVLVPLFGNKFYTHIIKERDAANKMTGNLIYTIQRNSALALDFTVGQEKL